jgi:hypothetical protein
MHLIDGNERSMNIPKRKKFSLYALGVPLITVTIQASTLLVFSQTGRPPKNFEQWSKNQAQKVLEESPWAVQQEVRLRYAGTARRIAGGTVPSETTGGLIDTTSNKAEMGGAEAPVDFQFTLRLRSAVTVRQALVRLKQLQAKYDEMNEKERAAFDDKYKGLLECPACEQNYVLTLSSESKQRPGADAVFTVFKGGRLADLERYIYIANSKGERRNLIHFVTPKAPGDEAVFYFSRFNDKGEPLLTNTDAEFIANFTNNDVNMNTNFKVNVSKLIVNGRVDF